MMTDSRTRMTAALITALIIIVINIVMIIAGAANPLHSGQSTANSQIDFSPYLKQKKDLQ